VSNDQRIPVLIAALSATARGSQRAQCRAAWFDAARRRTKHAVFVCGADGPRESGLLACQCPDTGLNAEREKLAAVLRWAAHCREWRHLFLCADDTEVDAAGWVATAAGVRAAYDGCRARDAGWGVDHVPLRLGIWLRHDVVPAIPDMLLRYCARYPTCPATGDTAPSVDQILALCLRDFGVYLPARNGRGVAQ